MIICTKEKCVWRNDIQEDKAYCFMRKCPYSRKLPENKKLKTPVKWAGMINKNKDYRNRKGEK